MVQLQSKQLDICRISKLLAKENIKASVSNQVITLDGEFTDELLAQICECITICKVRNFSSTEKLKEEQIEDTTIYEEVEAEQTEDTTVDDETEIEQRENISMFHQEVILEPRIIKKYDLIYPTVKRGEVYCCDMGIPYGSEQGEIRYVIIIQNDIGNKFSPTTIILECTTRSKKEMPTHYDFNFSNENMIDYDESRVGTQVNIAMAEQLQTVDKSRLRKYIGTMTPEFMDEIQKIIDTSLALNREEKIVEKGYKSVDRNVPKERKDLNMVQIQLLALVDIDKLLKISRTEDSDEIKAKKILNLFGFDLQKNGVQYLFKAIIISPKDDYFNLETLCENISKEEDAIKDEIKRLIVARVKEKFKFRKSPTIDFIRLVNSFLSKKEGEDLQDEETNI